jgi:hypothetical protein
MYVINAHNQIPAVYAEMNTGVLLKNITNPEFDLNNTYCKGAVRGDTTADMK